MDLLSDLEPPNRMKAIAAIAERYGLEMAFGSVPGLLEEHNLVFGPQEGGRRNRRPVANARSRDR